MYPAHEGFRAPENRLFLYRELRLIEDNELSLFECLVEILQKAFAQTLLLCKLLIIETDSHRSVGLEGTACGRGLHKLPQDVGLKSFLAHMLKYTEPQRKSYICIKCRKTLLYCLNQAIVAILMLTEQIKGILIESASDAVRLFEVGNDFTCGNLQGPVGLPFPV